jgi:hypothetical protein
LHLSLFFLFGSYLRVFENFAKKDKVPWTVPSIAQMVFVTTPPALSDQRGGGGEWMGADKNSSWRRLKLQQDELTRSDPQNHTLRTSIFRLPNPRSHWSATGPRNKHYQQPQLLHTHDGGNNSGAGCLQGAVRLGMGAVRPPPPGNQGILRNTSSEHQNAPQFYQQRSLVKAKLVTRKSWWKPKLHPKA